MECEGDRVLGEYVRKASAPPFLVKTYMMVEDPSTDAVISWNDGGTAFVVRQPAEFARDLLPTLFKHCNFSSFVRQLNTYGFRKVVTNRWEFSNDKFRRGERDRLCEIRRRKATPNKQQHSVQPPQAAARSENSDSEEQQRSLSPSTSSSSEVTNLIDENKQLKRENSALSSELEIVKRRCQKLVDLVDACGGSLERENQPREDDACGGSLERENQPRQDESRCLKLFGVKLEVGCQSQRC